MTTDELVEAIRVALTSDTILNDWCITQFGKAATVFIGTDPQKDPHDDDSPAIALISIDQSRGDDMPVIRWVIALGVGVVNPTRTVSGNSVIYAGLGQAERLRELAENALFRARIASMKPSGESNTECYKGWWVSQTAVTFEALRTTRRGLP